jgi:molybdate transport system regulatory protein
MEKMRLTVRVDLGADRAIGPGKVRLLEAIASTGSISKAGRLLGMSYRRAWLLIDDVNNCFKSHVVTTKPGGLHGGGAELTPFGEEVVRTYRTIETAAMKASADQLKTLSAALRAHTEPEKLRKTSIRKPRS